MTTGGHGCNSTLLAELITAANFHTCQVAGNRMLPSMPPPRDAGRRLSVDDWIQAGFALIVDGGPNALRVDKLCERLGVTKGSFYWHFADLPAYRTALLEAWGGLQDQDRQRFMSMPGAQPRQRLEAMMQALMSPQLFALERAMRI